MTNQIYVLLYSIARGKKKQNKRKSLLQLEMRDPCTVTQDIKISEEIIS